MTSDLAMFREHLMNLRRQELGMAHRLALEGNVTAFVRISTAANCAALIDKLLGDLRELETSPGGFAKRLGVPTDE